MKNVKKKMLLMAAIAAVAVGCVFSPCGVGSVQAKAAKPYMKKLGVRMDLKKNKTVSFQSCYAKVGMQKQTAKITNYKITDAEYRGYKKLTFTCVFRTDWEPDAKQIHTLAQVAEKDEEIGGSLYYAVVDYNTGKSLTGKKNDFGVVVEQGKWKHSGKTTYVDKDKCRVWWYTTRKVKVTVTYPESYKGLCIGVGGYNQLGQSKADKAFWNGKKVFGKTSYYKNGKKNSHFMRVKK